MTQSDSLRLPNRTLIKRGTKLTIDGIRGRCTFVCHVRTEGAEWIDVWTSNLHRRSVHPDRIKRVHRS